METVNREISKLTNAIDLGEVLKRACKYLVEGLAVGVAAYFIPSKKMNIEEVLMIAVTAAAVFALLDMYSPSIGASMRQGAGFGLGANLVGFPKLV
tara:strand:- start:294 stop:581 length:288 start_codon:yes stop_codon:yes gene_type:complete